MPVVLRAAHRRRPTPHHRARAVIHRKTTHHKARRAVRLRAMRLKARRAMRLKARRAMRLKARATMVRGMGRRAARLRMSRRVRRTTDQKATPVRMAHRATGLRTTGLRAMDLTTIPTVSRTRPRAATTAVMTRSADRETRRTGSALQATAHRRPRRSGVRGGMTVLPQAVRHPIGTVLLLPVAGTAHRLPAAGTVGTTVQAVTSPKPEWISVRSTTTATPRSRSSTPHSEAGASGSSVCGSRCSDQHAAAAPELLARRAGFGARRPPADQLPESTNLSKEMTWSYAL